MVHQSFDQDIDFFARKCIWVNGLVIVGAGPSGLAVRAGLKEQGVPFIVLERADCIASLWQKRTYDRLKLHLPKQFCQPPNFPFPDDFPEYPTKNQFLNYLESYAQHFDVSPNCSETVQSPKYDETFGHWRKVKTSISMGDSNPSAFAEVEYICRWLVVATGENSEKVVPEFEGLEEFKGNVVHACDYKSSLAYRGKQVLVVGCGNSGMEVSLDLCNHNASPSMVVRSSVHVLPREIFRKSTFELAVLLMKWLPLWLADKILLMLPWLLFGNLEKYGLKRPSLGPLERTDGASVLFGVKLRMSTPLVYDLGPEKSTGCVGVFLARKDCALALLRGELGATPLEELEESEKPAMQTQIKIVLQDDHTDRVAVIWAPHEWAVGGLVPHAVSCKDNKVLVLDDPEYVHYNAETIDLTSSQDKRFMLLKKISVSNSTNQHKCPAHSQGREIFSSSCNALPIVTDDIAVSKSSGNLLLPIKHGARVSQKDKLGLTFFFVILLLGWIPGVNAADENALLQGCTCTWICIIVVTIALVYFAYKIYSQPPPEPYLFSEKVLVLDDPEYVHYNAENVDLTSSQDKNFTLLKKTSVSNSANQHKCPACSQGREIFSGSCNTLPIVTDGDTVTERTLWLIKQRARLCQKNKMGITFLVMITMLGWIPGVKGVKAAEENASALVQGSTTTSTVVCVIIGTVALLYFSYKILEWFTLPPPVFPEPDWILFSRKVRIRTEGYMESAKMHFELFDAEDNRVGSWECSFVTEHGDIVDMVSWGTHLFNMMLHIFVEQEGGEQEISFNEMDHPDFINTAKDVYFHNPDTGLLQFIGISPPRNDLPGEREILRRRIWDAHDDATRW